MDLRAFGIDIGADKAAVAGLRADGWTDAEIGLNRFPTDLLGRVGEYQPCIQPVGGGYQALSPHEIFVEAVVEAMERSAARLGADPSDPVGLAVPSWWTERAVEWTHAGMSRRGMSTVTMFGAAECAVIGARALGDQVGPATVVVDLGARTSSASVVAEVSSGLVVVPGSSVVHMQGGEHLDGLLLHRVVALIQEMGVELDALDAKHVDAARLYLESCRQIRHELSARSSVAITPDLPGAEQRIRIVREEFEELAAPWRQEVVRVAKSAIAQSGMEVGSALLVGGVAHTPFVGQVLSAELDVEITIARQPMQVTAYGAALAVARTIPQPDRRKIDREPLSARLRRLRARRTRRSRQPVPVATIGVPEEQLISGMIPAPAEVSMPDLHGDEVAVAVPVPVSAESGAEALGENSVVPEPATAEAEAAIVVPAQRDGSQAGVPATTAVTTTRRKPRRRPVPAVDPSEEIHEPFLKVDHG